MGGTCKQIQQTLNYKTHRESLRRYNERERGSLREREIDRERERERERETDRQTDRQRQRERERQRGERTKVAL